MASVRRGKVDIVVCYKLGRLGRSLAHLAAMIAELTAHNVALVVPEQGIDTSSSNSAARLQFNVLCAVAEFEREIIRERVNDGIAAAKARGVRFGRPATLDAHRSDIARLRARGLTCRAMAKELDTRLAASFKSFVS
jgi:DNA invertase Pin-like site-specific DNA recombinase